MRSIDALALVLLAAARVGVDVAVGTFPPPAELLLLLLLLRLAFPVVALLLFGRFRTSSPEGVMSKSEGRMEGCNWTC